MNLPPTGSSPSSRPAAIEQLSTPFLATIGGRILLLAALGIIELLAVTLWLDAESLRRSHGLASAVFRFGPWTARAAVASAAFVLAFGYLDRDRRMARFARSPAAKPVSLTFLAAHVALACAFLWTSERLFHSGAAQPDMLATGWLVAALLAALAATLSFLSRSDWKALLAASGNTWLWGLCAGVLTSVLGSLWWSLWLPASDLTFKVVHFLLSRFTQEVMVNPAAREIGTPRFLVQIDPACSGLEGVGLVVVFSSVWLWLHRREFRFPRALLLLPLGAALIWLMNSVRITALILIGHGGAAGIAAGGFHSQAGWLTFIALAILIAHSSRKIPWLLRQPEAPGPSPVQRQYNGTAAYLMPFLAILAASMVSRAASSGFEWLYPLRFFAAAAALWMYRDSYRALDWRAGWLAPVTGAAVFGLWMGLERLFPAAGANPVAEVLASSPAWLAALWIAFRAFAHIVTVPIAEELAFRGFLIRRVLAEDFECLDTRRFTWLSLAISSIAFGVMHGDRWIAGSLAGLLYAGAYLWRGRIGDAVVAHATTNALLAVYVLATRSWNLW